ncbi:uncharacterized protein LOC124420626 [Lucilia cuprina]|uniref:uncharacterized protein LOC124420626 n=1 Tax=Lucilia cuprina TaxID=7375 RepID=UPI001F056DCF|nr:uncharacterized protein LOC124420626 [Lucilia cuprina]
MDAPDLRALVDSFTDGRVTDLSDAFANFSTEMLQQANALLAATATSTNGLLDTDTNTDAIIHLEDIEVAAALALSNTDTLVNRTLEMQCLRQQQQDERTAVTSLNSPANFISCPVSFDSVLCWPRTPAGTWAVLPCFEEFKGVHYDSTLLNICLLSKVQILIYCLETTIECNTIEQEQQQQQSDRQQQQKTSYFN